jgi:hypothetical protein
VVPCVRELRYLSSNTKENEECSVDLHLKLGKTIVSSIFKDLLIFLDHANPISAKFCLCSVLCSNTMIHTNGNKQCSATQKR